MSKENTAPTKMTLNQALLIIMTGPERSASATIAYQRAEKLMAKHNKEVQKATK